MSKKGLSDSESRLFMAVIKQVDDKISGNIDWSKVAEETGYKDGNNARTMFSRFKKRMVEDAVAGGDSAAKVKPSPRRGPNKRKAADAEDNATAGANIAASERVANGKTNTKTKRVKKNQKSEAVVKEESEDGNGPDAAESSVMDVKANKTANVGKALAKESSSKALKTEVDDAEGHTVESESGEVAV